MNRTFTPLTFCFLFVSLYLQAQEFNWAKTAAFAGVSSAKALAVDSKNNIYVCGALQDSADFGSGPVYGNGSFVVKYTGNGQCLWAIAVLHARIKSISCDPLGHPYITGVFTDTMRLGKYHFKSTGAEDFFVARLDTLGGVLWAKKGGGPGNDVSNAVKNDFQGNVYICGSFENYMNADSLNSLLSVGGTDIFIIQYDSLGALQWIHKAGGEGNDAGIGLGIGLSGYIYMTGTFRDSAIFYRTLEVSKGGDDIFLTCYNSLGGQVAAFAMGGPGDDAPANIAMDGSSNFYMTGTFRQTADFAGYKITSNGGTDAFLAFFSNNRTCKWVKSIGGIGDEAAPAVCADGSSNAILAASFSSGFSLSSLNFNVKGGADIFMLKYDVAGRLLWGYTAGGAGADSVFAMGIDNRGNAVMTGTFGGEADFGNIHLVSSGGQGYFLARANGEMTGEKPLAMQLGTIQVYPNPAGDIIFISAADRKNIVELCITDAAGRTVARCSMNASEFSAISLEGLPDGIYWLRAAGPEGYSFTKFIKISGS